MGLKVVPKKLGKAVSAKKPGKTVSPKAKGKISPSVPSNMVKSEAEWQAEDDARTLMRAEEIKRNATRLRKAKAVAQQKANEALQVAKL